MSIRIRVIGGITVALCAARSVEQPGDIYLDDAAHHALSQKFVRDFYYEGHDSLHNVLDHAHADVAEREESNNANRTWWDGQYGAGQ